jgi:hypothetical protein
MTPLLYSALLFACGVDDTARVGTLRVAAQAWQSGKRFIGLTEKELVRELGEPTSRKPGVWEYWKRLGPGFHSHQWVRVVRFDGGRVTAAPIEMRPVGCIIVEPRERPALRKK